MTTQPTNQLASKLNEIDSRLKLLESANNLFTLKFESIEKKKDDTTNLKSSHQAFTSSFNETILKIKTELETRKQDVDSQFAAHDIALDSLKKDLTSSIEALRVMIEIIDARTCF